MDAVLTALAQAYAITGDSAYKSKGDHMVNALASCQAASPGRGYHAGYLSAFPENFFDRLESGQTVWAPWYTLHKILAGLLDQYALAGNAQALTVATNMAGWVDWRTGRLSASQMQAVLNTEFGGMNAALADLYQQTGDARWMTAAQRFDHAAVFTPLAVTYGPVVLAGNYGSTTLSAPPALATASVTRTNGTALTFTATANGSTVPLIPFYDAHTVNYNVYWNTGGGPSGRPHWLGTDRQRHHGLVLDSGGNVASGSNHKL
ncbi:beta-L-arabinofuranosidase domain-containing protein [Sphaerisporangium sp. NPDC004334]